VITGHLETFTTAHARQVCVYRRRFKPLFKTLKSITIVKFGVNIGLYLFLNFEGPFTSI